MSGSIYDALNQQQPGTDPSLMGLLGAAGGFAQAAMPKPYKGGTPFGAVLGMGAAGMGDGYGTAYHNQLAQAQAQGQQINNVATASQLPLTMARNNALASIYQDPAKMAALMTPGQSPGSAPQGGAAPNAPQIGGAPPQAGAAPAGGSLVAPALASITDPTARSAAVNAALRSGLPQQAWAPWIAAVHNESGWNLGSPDGKSGEIGPGQVMPATGQGLGYTEAQLRDPPTNLLASAQYFKQKWGQSNGDPVGAFTGYNTGDVKGSAPAYAALGMARLNGWAAPPAAPAAPGAPPTSGAPPVAGAAVPNQADPAAMVKYYEGEANRVSQAKLLGLPVSGDDKAMLTAAQQWRDVLTAGPKAQAAANVELATAGPKALAVARNSNLQLRPGGMAGLPDGNGNYTIVKNPELKEVEDPATGQKTYVHINPASPFAPPGTPGESAPVLAPGGTPAVAAISPQQQDARNAAVHDFQTKDQDSYQAAQNTQAWLNQIDHASVAMNKQGGPAYMTGPFANIRYGLMSNVNDLGRTLGIPQDKLFDQNSIANWEEMKKATTTAGFELSSHYEGHARQAASTIVNATSAVPAPTNSPQGLALVSAGIREGAQAAIDAHEYKQGVYNQTQGAGLENAETDFYKANPPQMYANRAISTQSPFTVSGPAEFTKYLPGTFVTDGKTIDPQTNKPKIIQVPERPGAPKMPTYIQQGAPNAP